MGQSKKQNLEQNNVSNSQTRRTEHYLVQTPSLDTATCSCKLSRQAAKNKSDDKVSEKKQFQPQKNADLIPLRKNGTRQKAEIPSKKVRFNGRVKVRNFESSVSSPDQFIHSSTNLKGKTLAGSTKNKKLVNKQMKQQLHRSTNQKSKKSANLNPSAKPGSSKPTAVKNRIINSTVNKSPPQRKSRKHPAQSTSKNKSRIPNDQRYIVTDNASRNIAQTYRELLKTINFLPAIKLMAVDKNLRLSRDASESINRMVILTFAKILSSIQPSRRTISLSVTRVTKAVSSEMPSTFRKQALKCGKLAVENYKKDMCPDFMKPKLRSDKDPIDKNEEQEGRSRNRRRTTRRKNKRKGRQLTFRKRVGRFFRSFGTLLHPRDVLTTVITVLAGMAA